MTFTDADARQQLLDALAAATDEIGLALTALGDAYERLDDSTADRLEQELFRPVQVAYGRAQRTYAEFAGRHDLPGRTFASGGPSAPSKGAPALVEEAVDAARRADSAIATLQDSMLPVEFGDPPLRAGLEEVRMLIGELGQRARRLVRTIGR